MAEKKSGKSKEQQTGAAANGNGAALSFEDGLEQLETIVKQMEQGDLPLEKSIELFERGMKLSDSCRKQLAEAETRVEILTKRAGEMEPEPFDNPAARSAGLPPEPDFESDDDDEEENDSDVPF